MKRWVAVAVAVMLASAALRADVTVTQSVTMAGGPAAMAAGAPMPRVVTQIKGMKMRIESGVAGNTTVTLVDLATKQILMLNAADKTARALDSASTPVPKDTPVPEMESSFKATGQSKTIDAVACDEYAISMTMDMANMAGRGGQMPPEAAEMMKDMKMVMTGSSWLAKSGAGIAEFLTFQKGAVEAGLGGAMLGAMGGAGNGLDKILKASATANGMPYLTEMTITIEGAGPMADMMKQMGSMTVTNKVTAISTDALSDDLFKVPADYKLVK